MNNENKLNENDEVTGTLLDSDDMVGEVEQILENPASLPPELQYDSARDPEYDASEMREAFWTGYVFGERMNEAFSIKNIIADYIKNNGKADVAGIAASLPDSDKSAKYYKTHLDQLETAVNKYLAAHPQEVATAEPAKPFSPDDLTNDLAKELISGDSGNIDSVMTAKESSDDKFDTIYTIAKTIFQGKGIKHHAFIYGDPGVGKCASYNEKIPVRMDDAIAEAYEAWLESRQK